VDQSLTDESLEEGKQWTASAYLAFHAETM